MKCISGLVWITSDSSVFVRYNQARYHEIVLKLPFLSDIFPDELDLVDQANWEDNVLFLTLEEAGLEERELEPFDCVGASVYNEQYWDGSSSEVTE